MAQKPRFVVADGPIKSSSTAAAGIDPTEYVFQFSSRVILCDTDSVGTFTNRVRCRKWTDLSGHYFNTPCRVAAPEPRQPDPGCIVNVGDILITIEGDQPQRKIECPNFTLEGTQTYGIKVLLSSFVVFLFTGEGKGRSKPLSGGGAGDEVTVRGAGSCLESLDPNGPPKVDSWSFIFTIC